MPAARPAPHTDDRSAAGPFATPDSWPAPPGYSVVRLAAPLVPSSRREEWLAEWAGELAWGWREAGERDEWSALAHFRLRRRALGAIADALSLRRRQGAHMSLHLDLRHAARVLRRRPGFVTV